ncbi:MAG: M15 family metallopeptidase [Thermoleophilia bacterium]|nr:M15 family metallopeptidase [Thermoleophilia bacterium]
MTRSRPAGTVRRAGPVRRMRGVLLLAVLAVGVAIAVNGLSGSPDPAPPSSTSPPPSGPGPAGEVPRAAPGAPATPGGDGLGVADGAVPDHTGVFDESVPGVTRLDPVLLGALRAAATDAAADGVTFVVDSGWRSPAYQRHLLDEAIAEHGSEAEALRWVASPRTSAHVSGDAVDIGPSRADEWLSLHGAGYGLCQVYGNEPWHYELRPEAVGGSCPAMYPDPTHDPRMRG